ncbi:hypothetical protein TVAG_463340 [Trichomonas vaginalis G3]|uniref:Uncharacterized protein n=1 Tax=Trichomonas vaginalis (strain ATCC PRA-98 / G3) TaxID=412133 RepID=A2EH06_TRIV3|nr:tricorn protease domain 2 family [Trichomonas vaginalis G3]EAY08054.1 hypothetical protein TVAG_463340 [Trichomonas vaginalis G3]KAI5543029.1 tricorn protease domain 2 family [Trichomonas vaginalis G3]|eukprot:XP_001320277.1 hypothetical protein [Trichomonas vaginalis G3]
MADADIIIGRHRRAVPFSLGCGDSFKILRKPISQLQELSHNYIIFLNSKSHHPLLNTVIGTSYDRNALTVHDVSRNHFLLHGSLLFEAINSRITFIKDPWIPAQWDANTSSVSTRSKCTNFSINKENTFGFASTLTKPAIFSLSYTLSELRFNNITYLNYDLNILDLKTSDFIPGETITISKDNTISLFDKDTIVSSVKVEGHETWDLSPINFLQNPRVVCTGFSDSLQIIDFRQKEPAPLTAAANFPSSIVPLKNPFHLVVSTPDNLSIYDMRFPHRPEDILPYYFKSCPTSMKVDRRGDFDVVFCQCSESSEVIAFPFNDMHFGAPCMPFQLTVADYITKNPSNLTGLEVISDSCYLQFENGGVFSVDLDPSKPAKKINVPVFIRNEEDLPKDNFIMKPQFDEMDFSQDKTKEDHINWKETFPEMKNAPPNSLYEIKNEEIPEADSVIDNYLIEIEDALQFEDDDLDTAIPAIWKNHLDTISKYLQQTE